MKVKYLPIIFSVFYTLLLLFFPKESMGGVISGLEMCAKIIIPSLFPFMVASGIICAVFSKSTPNIMKFFMNKVFHLPGSTAPVLLMGLIGGYPVGASACKDLYNAGGCTKSQGERLLAFCTCSSPTFVAGMVGALLLGNYQIGWIIFAIQASVAVLIGLVYGYFEKSNVFDIEKSIKCSTKVVPFSQTFVNSVRLSSVNMLYICGFIVIFSSLLEILLKTEILANISNMLVFFFPNIKEIVSKSVFYGFLEVSQGVILSTALTFPLNLIITSGIIGWGGICVHLQIMAIMSDTGFSLKPYLLGKFLQCIICAVITCFVLEIFQITLPAFTASEKIITPFAPFFGLLLFLIFGSFILICKRQLKHAKITSSWQL